MSEDPRSPGTPEDAPKRLLNPDTPKRSTDQIPTPDQEPTPDQIPPHQVSPGPELIPPRLGPFAYITLILGSHFLTSTQTTKIIFAVLIGSACVIAAYHGWTPGENAIENAIRFVMRLPRFP